MNNPKKCLKCNCDFSDDGIDKIISNDRFTENEICPDCFTRQLGKFWFAKNNWRISIESDGDKFIAQIQAGMDGETYLSVGYSCPNGAWVNSKNVDAMKFALDEAWEKTEQKDLEEMMPALLNLCKVANKVFNDALFSEYKR
jgi:hypothetical protein